MCSTPFALSSRRNGHRRRRHWILHLLRRFSSSLHRPGMRLWYSLGRPCCRSMRFSRVSGIAPRASGLMSSRMVGKGDGRTGESCPGKSSRAAMKREDDEDKGMMRLIAIGMMEGWMGSRKEMYWSESGTAATPCNVSRSRCWLRDNSSRTFLARAVDWSSFRAFNPSMVPLWSYPGFEGLRKGAEETQKSSTGAAERGPLEEERGALERGPTGIWATRVQFYTVICTSRSHCSCWAGDMSIDGALHSTVVIQLLSHLFSAARPRINACSFGDIQSDKPPR